MFHWQFTVLPVWEFCFVMLSYHNLVINYHSQVDRPASYLGGSGFK
jgi:hypothetical protein